MADVNSVDPTEIFANARNEPNLFQVSSNKNLFAFNLFILFSGVFVWRMLSVGIACGRTGKSVSKIVQTPSASQCITKQERWRFQKGQLHPREEGRRKKRNSILLYGISARLLCVGVDGQSECVWVPDHAIRTHHKVLNLQPSEKGNLFYWWIAGVKTLKMHEHGWAVEIGENAEIVRDKTEGMIVKIK